MTPLIAFCCEQKKDSLRIRIHDHLQGDAVEFSGPGLLFRIWANQIWSCAAPTWAWGVIPDFERTRLSRCVWRARFFPKAGEEVITSIGNLRGGQLATHAADAPSVMPNGSDEDEVQKAIPKIKVSREYAKRVGGPASSRVATAPVTRRAANSGGDPLRRGNPEREWAAKLFPARQGCKIHKDVPWHQRWRWWYPDGAQDVYSQRWTGTISPLQALQSLLNVIWHLHSECMSNAGQPRHECPFDIDAPPEINPV